MSLNHGGFTIKSAIKLIQNNTSTDSNHIWTGIWNLQAPQRLKFFLWLVVHERLMTNAHRVQRNLATDPSCRICSHHEEDINHILRHCNLAKEVWANLLSPQQASTFFGLPLRTWISSNIEPGGSNPKDWPLVFTTTVWWLWKWRNHRCFEDLTYKPREPTRFIIARAKEYTKILEAKDPTSLQVESIPRDEVLIRWEFPPDL